MWVKIYIFLSGRIPMLRLCWMESIKKWRRDLKNQSLVFVLSCCVCWHCEGGKKVRVTPFLPLRFWPYLTSKSCNNCNGKRGQNVPKHMRWDHKPWAAALWREGTPSIRWSLLSFRFWYFHVLSNHNIPWLTVTEPAQFIGIVIKMASQEKSKDKESFLEAAKSARIQRYKDSVSSVKIQVKNSFIFPLFS